MLVIISLAGSVLASWTVMSVSQRRSRHRLVLLRESARSEGAVLTARTIRHQLANKLSVTLTYCELLLEQPQLSHELEDYAERIKTSATAAVEALDGLQRDILHLNLDTALAGPALLDLGKSSD